MIDQIVELGIRTVEDCQWLVRPQRECAFGCCHYSCDETYDMRANISSFVCHVDFPAQMAQGSEV